MRFLIAAVVLLGASLAQKAEAAYPVDVQVTWQVPSSHYPVHQARMDVVVKIQTFTQNDAVQNATPTLGQQSCYVSMYADCSYEDFYVVTAYVSKQIVSVTGASDWVETPIWSQLFIAGENYPYPDTVTANLGTLQDPY